MTQEAAKPLWPVVIASAIASAVFLGVPTGVALLVLTQGDQDFWVRRFPGLFGLAASAVVYYVSTREGNVRRTRWRQLGLGAVALLAADVLVIVAFMRSRGVL